MQYSNAVSEAEVLDFEGGWVSMRWRYCRWRGGWSLVLLLLRWCCGSLGRLRLLEKERAETLGIRLGDEAALCRRGRQDCGIPQIGQLGWTAGGAEDLQLLAGLNRAVVSIELYGDMTTCWYLVYPSQGNIVEDQLEDLGQTQSVLATDIEAGYGLPIQRCLL